MYNLFTNCSKEIKCSIHPTYNIQFALLKKNESNQAFYCSLCVLQQNIDSKYLISTDNATNQAPTEPIFNWPLGINQNILSYLQDCSSNNKKEQIKQKIEEYYEDLEQQIMNQLKESKREALNDLESSIALKSDLINIYNYEFKRSELKDLLNQNTQCTNEEFWDFVNKVDESKDKVLRELEEKIKSISCIQNQLEKGTPYMIKQVFNQLTKQINFFGSSQNPYLSENSRQDNSQQTDNNKEIIQTIFERVQHELNNKSQIEQNLQERNKEYLKIKKDIEELIQELKTNKKLETNTLTNLAKNIDQIQMQLAQFDNLKIANFLDNIQQTKRYKVVKQLLYQYHELNQINQDKIENYISDNQQKNIFQEIIFYLLKDDKDKVSSSLNQAQENQSLFSNLQQTKSNQKQEISLNKSINISKQNEFKQNNTASLFDNSQQAQIQQKQELSSDKPILISNQNQVINKDPVNQQSLFIQKQELFSKSLFSNQNQLQPNTSIQSNPQQAKIQQKQELSSDNPNLISNQDQVQKSEQEPASTGLFSFLSKQNNTSSSLFNRQPLFNQN
ncbi:hypothetical protein ABPG74_014421 [Tetrahymena malaccensis]